ncbi:MAG: STAS domain-containing protein [Anaerolineales bacterium]|nr:STAS domain-containing protein [Anaerolineales bacterium]
MQISFSKQEAVTIMHILGDVDSSSYTDVINKAQEAYDEGARNLLVDLSKVPYVSSAGLMAFHTVARIFTGQPVMAKDGNRPSFRAIHPQEDGSAREHVKLLSPQPPVEQVLDMVGLAAFFKVFTDLETAVSSFQ